MTKSLPPAADFQKAEQAFKTLCRNVLSSGQGKEMLEHLERIYCDGKLYQNNDRETVYCVAQRDLIMELKHNSKGELA
jgi:hypothetical protein